MKVTLDSRQIKKGDYFVAVKGENFDGHNFIDAALKNGAKGILEEQDLYKIASEKLLKINPIVIGVAGSVGKSTFRSYLTQVLSYKYKTLEGTLNTKLGLATNVVNGMKSDDKVLVAEMGIDRLGEMQQTAAFIKPSFSVITKLEKEHLQFLKNIKNVVKENIYAISLSKDKFGYINKSDQELVANYVKNLDINFFSSKQNKVLSIVNKNLYSDHELDYLDCIYKIAAQKFNFTDKEFLIALNGIKRPKGRLNIIKGKNGSTIIDDSYNAVCDQSVIKGIKFALKRFKGKNLHIVVSPLRETGDSSVGQHKNVADFLNKNFKKFSSVTLIGDTGDYYLPHLNFKPIVINDSRDYFSTPTKNDVYYIKGSQFYRAERCLLKIMLEPKKAKDLLVRQDERWV